MNATRNCRECGEAIKGRADKKFCDDQCRSNYNNKVNSDTTAEMRNINNILRRNRRILDALAKAQGKRRVSRMSLQDQGFNFRYFTQIHTTQKGTLYKLCYDYGYMPVENDYIVVVKWGKD